MVKSNWYDVAANPRDSLCSTVSEIRLDNSWAFFETGVRALVSKVSNWTLSSSSSSSSTFQAALAVQLLAETNPVDRAEKLPALCSFVQRRNKRMRRTLRRRLSAPWSKSWKSGWPIRLFRSPPLKRHQWTNRFVFRFRWLPR